MVKKDRYNPSWEENFRTLFYAKKSGLEKMTRIESVGTPVGPVAIGIFPYYGMWHGSFFTMYGLVHRPEELTVARLFTGASGEPTSEDALTVVRTGLVTGSEGNVVFDRSLPKGEYKMVGAGLEMVAQSGSYYDPAKGAEGARVHLRKILEHNEDLGDPVLTNTAKVIANMEGDSPFFPEGNDIVIL